jgi:hypothetical protein
MNDLRKFIKNIIKEFLNEQKEDENNLNSNIWYHGTDKEFIEPKIFVGEFGNMGGFFLTKSINFAKRWGKYIKKFKLKSNIKIFDFDNEDDFMLYAEEVAKKIKLPNIGILHYAVLLNGYTDVEGLEYVMRTIYPDLKTNVFNIIMDDMGNKYDKIQYIIRKKRLYRDYKSIEENDKTIMDAGFDGAFVWENKNRNLQIFNLNKIFEVL